jgi:hypothetical protein
MIKMTYVVNFLRINVIFNLGGDGRMVEEAWFLFAGNG